MSDADADPDIDGRTLRAELGDGDDDDPRMPRVTFRLEPRLIDALDQLVDQGYYANRSTAIRTAIREKFAPADGGGELSDRADVYPDWPEGGHQGPLDHEGDPLVGPGRCRYCGGIADDSRDVKSVDPGPRGQALMAGAVPLCGLCRRSLAAPTGDGCLCCGGSETRYSIEVEGVAGVGELDVHYSGSLCPDCSRDVIGMLQQLADSQQDDFVTDGGRRVRDLPEPPRATQDNYRAALAKVYRALGEAEVVAPDDGQRQFVEDVRDRVRDELIAELDGGDEDGV